jgi:large subunit ribosomal protein L22
MIAKASASFVRISPRKVRYVIDLIRRKSVAQAHAILNGSPRRARDIVRKLLDQAVDAAQRNSQVNAKDLVVSKILADGGPSMKRFRAATMGRANRIRKRTSHIQLELDMSKKSLAVASGTVVKETKAKRAPSAAPVPVKGGSAFGGKKEKKFLNKKTVGAK